MVVASSETVWGTHSPPLRGGECNAPPSIVYQSISVGYFDHSLGISWPARRSCLESKILNLSELGASLCSFHGRFSSLRPHVYCFPHLQLLPRLSRSRAEPSREPSLIRQALS